MNHLPRPVPRDAARQVKTNMRYQWFARRRANQTHARCGWIGWKARCQSSGSDQLQPGPAALSPQNRWTTHQQRPRCFARRGFRGAAPHPQRHHALLPAKAFAGDRLPRSRAGKGRRLQRQSLGCRQSCRRRSCSCGRLRPGADDTNALFQTGHLALR